MHVVVIVVFILDRQQLYPRSRSVAEVQLHLLVRLFPSDADCNRWKTIDISETAKGGPVRFRSRVTVCQIAEGLTRISVGVLHCVYGLCCCEGQFDPGPNPLLCRGPPISRIAATAPISGDTVEREFAVVVVRVDRGSRTC